MGSFIERTCAQIRNDVGDSRVILGLSGGVDSSVAAALLHRAIGDQLTCVFVDHGLLRLDEGDQVMRTFAQHLGIQRAELGIRALQAQPLQRRLAPGLAGAAALALAIVLGTRKGFGTRPMRPHNLTLVMLGAAGNVAVATRRINARFGMANDFPVFMAVADVAWFAPALIRPDSPVPTGIGSAPYLDRLQRHLGLPDHESTMRRMIELQPEHWPEARRPFTPIDVEYLCCECRKYCSYVNGTKRFEGRNAFVARGGA